jgi:hypothetical protein
LKKLKIDVEELLNFVTEKDSEREKAQQVYERFWRDGTHHSIGVGRLQGGLLERAWHSV